MILTVTERAALLDRTTEELIHKSGKYEWQREKIIIETFCDENGSESKTRTDYYSRPSWQEGTLVQVVRKYNRYDLCTVGKSLVSVHFMHDNEVKEAKSLEELNLLDEDWAKRFGL